ncbi:MAG: putative toxin-antitoxin system toxin component, PIN family [Candidatus Nitrotoga sp.]
MRVVLDTNVILSALLFDSGNLAWLRNAWQAKSIRPVISNATKEDLFESLSYPKFNLSIAEQDLLLEDFFPYSETASVSSWMPSHGIFSQVFLAVAHKAKVDALISVEKDILALRGSFTPSILTVEELRKRLQEERLA